jgi:hypothetical protein
MPKKNYEERKQEKIEAYEALAAKKAEESEGLWKQQQQMSDVIPMGQPILVGHHSEQMHRNHLKKIDNKIRKAIDVGKVADHYEHKAAAMKNNTAISSDDPKAIEKLNAKIESEKALHAKAKAKRKHYRDNKEELIAELGDRVYHQRYYLLEAYMTGYLANIKRLKDRIKGLEMQENIQEEKVENNGISMEVNKEENRVMIFFPGKPDEEVRTKLKRHGFRWSPRNMAWQAYIKQWNIDFAKEIVQG